MRFDKYLEVVADWAKFKRSGDLMTKEDLFEGTPPMNL